MQVSLADKFIKGEGASIETLEHYKTMKFQGCSARERDFLAV